MKKYIFLTLLLLGIISCKKNDIPAEIYIPEVTTNLSPGQGSENHKITDLYVYIGSEFLGVFPIPARIPVTLEGTQSYRILAGIRASGILGDPKTFNLLDDVMGEIDLVAGQTTELAVSFPYKNEAVFSFVENFESGNIFDFVVSGNTSHGLLSSDIDVLEGAKSGVFYVNEDTPAVEIANNNLLTEIPIDGSDVYLEIEYKNTAEFHIGLIGYVDGAPITEYIINLFPKDDWNKLYLELTPEIFGSGLDSYRIVFLIGLPSDDNGNIVVTEAEVNIDNVKLVHF